MTKGLKTCRIALRFDGNDLGGIMIEENVVTAAGAHHRASEEELRRITRGAGFELSNSAHQLWLLLKTTRLRRV